MRCGIRNFEYNFILSVYNASVSLRDLQKKILSLLQRRLLQHNSSHKDFGLRPQFQECRSNVNL